MFNGWEFVLEFPLRNFNLEQFESYKTNNATVCKCTIHLILENKFDFSDK